VDKASPTLAVLGYGFIGRRIALLASRRGWRVRALSHRPGAVPEDPSHRLYSGDAADPAVAADILEGADHVVFAAGTVKPAESDAHPLEEVSANLGPIIATLEAMGRLGTPSLTFLSSAGTVYGPQAPVPTSEGAPLWPISSYGVLKVAAERYVNLYADRFSLAADILRCANVYGPGEPEAGSQGLIGVTRAALRAGRPVVLFGDGSTRRDFVHVDDVADAVERLARQPSGVRVLNVGSGRSESVAEVIDAVAASLGVQPEFDRRPSRASDAPLVMLDISQLRSVIPFEPRDVRTALLRRYDEVTV
jgi:UDP-glucose 4-epimerase